MAAGDSSTAPATESKTTKEDAKATTTTTDPQPSSADIEPLIEPSLYRLTEGLPKFELKLIATEAQACEELLEAEIKQLEEALAKASSQDFSSSKESSDVLSTKAEESSKEAPASATGEGTTTTSPVKKSPVDIMLDVEFTPPDRYFTVSALLGRLRDDLATPLPPNSTLPALRAQHGLLQPPTKKKKTNTTPTNAAAAGGGGFNANTNPEASSTSSNTTKPEPQRPLTGLEKQQRVLTLETIPEYRKEQETPTVLLALWKKISTHRTSVVFRRPVNPKEAPSYADRILFPMDLSLVRKLIVARMVKSYADLHIRIGLICHNCVKYNGRESDYGLVTREFEGVVDEFIVAAVMAAAAASKALPPAAPASINGSNASSNSPKDAARPAKLPVVEHPPKTAATTATTAVKTVTATSTVKSTALATTTTSGDTKKESSKKTPPVSAPEESKTEKKTPATATKKKS